MPRKTKPIADQLRQLIRKAEKKGTTRYQIAKVSGVSEAQLSRLMSGDAAPRIDTTERILAAIGHKLTIVKVDNA